MALEATTLPHASTMLPIIEAPCLVMKLLVWKRRRRCAARLGHHGHPDAHSNAILIHGMLIIQAWSSMYNDHPDAHSDAILMHGMLITPMHSIHSNGMLITPMRSIHSIQHKPKSRLHPQGSPSGPLSWSDSLSQLHATIESCQRLCRDGFNSLSRPVAPRML